MASDDLPFAVKLQLLMGRFFYFPFIGPILLCFLMTGIKIKNQKELRKFYKEITDKTKPPLLICPNHMTYIDSGVLLYAFGSHLWYTFNFRRLMWNLVAAEYAKNPFFKFVCYFSKCIFIDRARERSKGYPTLTTAQNLLKKGEVVLVFPEGRRTKTGRFDDEKLAPGIGKIVSNLGECRVLCVYLRCPEIGEKSRSFPPRNAHYEILTDLVHYKIESKSNASIVEVTKDVSTRIKALEKRYFES